MIDDKVLAEDEREQKMLANYYANYPDMVGVFKKRIEIIRLARRYLALRENEISIMQLAVQDFDHSAFRVEYDAAADRLLEGGE